MLDDDARTLLAELESAPRADLPSLTNDDAVDIGVIAVQIIRERELDLAVDIVVGADLVFRAKQGATGPENDEWLAGKAATVRAFEAPSLLVRLRHEADGVEFEERVVDDVILRGAGGSVPLYVDGSIAGTLTLSGEPDTVDHATAIDVLAAYISARG